MATKARLPVALILLLFGTACTRSGEAPKAEPVALNVTHWTDKTELYMEYPPLVTGETARFAVHLTKLNDFQALNAGTPSLEFTPERGGTSLVLRGRHRLAPARFEWKEHRQRRVGTVGRWSSRRPVSPTATIWAA
jgi:hypothetical protein